MESVKEIVQSNLSNAQLRAETMEKVLLTGDLSALTARERLNYYSNVCITAGLNPLTKPFDYLNLSGKLVLYANRGCAEQLRQIHNVSLMIKSREAVEGCYVVSAAATLPSGRSDESIGTVSIEGLKGETRSNAMMKAETKAKRRVTLSICGLTLLDESEIESLRDAQRIAVDPQTGEILEKTSAFREMIEAFAKLKQELGPDGEDLYYGVLARYDVKHSNEFKRLEDARSAYRELREAALNFQPAAQTKK